MSIPRTPDNLTALVTPIVEALSATITAPADLGHGVWATLRLAVPYLDHEPMDVEVSFTDDPASVPRLEFHVIGATSVSTAAANRSPADIARQITTRLLPASKYELDVTRQEQERLSAMDTAADSTAIALSSALTAAGWGQPTLRGMSADRHHVPGNGNRTVVARKGNCWVEASIGSGESVQLRMVGLSEEQASSAISSFPAPT